MSPTQSLAKHCTANPEDTQYLTQEFLLPKFINGKAPRHADLAKPAENAD